MKQKRLTEGSLTARLLGFSLPFLLANLLQALYGAADLLFVGRFAGAAAVSAVATGGQVMQTVTGVAVGLTTGGTVLVGRAFGARKPGALSEAVGAVLCVFGVLAAVLTVAVGFGIGPVCALMRVPPEALAGTRQYLAVCSLGVPLIVGFNAACAVLRGLGDSRTPLYVAAAACVCNVAGDALLVGGLGLGARGAAVATVLSQGAALVFAFFYLLCRGLVRRYRRSYVPVQAVTARQLLGVGLPIAAQEALVNVSFLLITAIVNTLGVSASAAVGVVEKLIVVSMLPTTAFASAVAAMTAQHLGAGLYRRAACGLRLAAGMALVPACACFAAAQLRPEALVALFTADGTVIAAGAAYLRAYSLDCVLVCFVFCLNAYFAGCGRALFPLAHSLAATALVRVPLSLAAVHTGSLFAVGCAAPAASAASLVLCLLYLRRLNARLFGNAKGKRR